MASPLIMLSILLYCSGFRLLRPGFASTVVVVDSYRTPAGGLSRGPLLDTPSRPTDRATPSTPKNC